MLYAPLMAAMLAPLYRIFWWDGWSLFLVLASSVGLATVVGGIAASGPNRPRWERITGGVGLGGIAFWILTTNPWHGMFTGRLDPLSWLFALGGLCVLALAVAHRWPRIWPAVLLLTAGFWTKQPTIAVIATAFVGRDAVGHDWCDAMADVASFRRRTGAHQHHPLRGSAPRHARLDLVLLLRSTEQAHERFSHHSLCFGVRASFRGPGARCCRRCRGGMVLYRARRHRGPLS